MRIDRSHLGWLIFTLAATAGCALLYVANFAPHRLPFPVPLPGFFGAVPPRKHSVGGTPLGLVFGSLGFAIFLFASALSVRKRQRLWPIGHVRRWLKAHIWLSILTVPLVLFHCGFRAGGQHAQALLALYTVVMGSGFVGLALQQALPRMMKDRLPQEVVFEQIPRLRARLFDAAADFRRTLAEAGRLHQAKARAGVAVLAEDVSVRTLEQFLDEECLPYLSARKGSRRRLGDPRSAAGVFRVLRATVAASWHPGVNALERWCDERRWMDVQTTLQHWLHGWLVVHIPASLALLVLTAWHAWSAVRFLVVAP